jgi:protein-S-isoprenylcysteine O-methyltransferase Ste14
MSALFLLISEAVSLLIIITARRPKAQDFTPGHMILVITGSFLVPLFVQAPDDKAICPTWATDIVVLVGAAWTIFAKLSLGRSFGLLAANRAVKSEGAYRFIRHPIYFGYFVMHMAFLLSHFVLINLLIFTQLYIIQSLRILHEERLLSQDVAYRDYCERTKYRFIFGLF